MLQLCCNIDATSNTIATRMLQLWWWNSQRMCNEYIPPHGSACLQHMQRYVCGYLHGILIAASVQPPCSSRPSLLYNYVMGTSCSPGAMQLMQHITNGLLNGSDVGYHTIIVHLCHKKFTPSGPMHICIPSGSLFVRNIRVIIRSQHVFIRFNVHYKCSNFGPRTHCMCWFVIHFQKYLKNGS